MKERCLRRPWPDSTLLAGAICLSACHASYAGSGSPLDAGGGASEHDAVEGGPGQTCGVCGCGLANVDTDGDGFSDCQDGCPTDPAKQVAGTCGCNHLDPVGGVCGDADGDGWSDRDERVCGTHAQRAVDVPLDGDGDGTCDPLDGCPTDPAKTASQRCGCGSPEPTEGGTCGGHDGDGDGVDDATDSCLAVGNPTQVDTDGDGVCDSGDVCPSQALPHDSDGNGVADCLDEYVAFFPFSGDHADQGPHAIRLQPSRAGPRLSPNRKTANGKSYLFKDADDSHFVNTDYPTRLAFGTELTVSVWVKLNENADGQAAKVVGRVWRGKVNGVLTRYGWSLGVSSEGWLNVEVWDAAGEVFGFAYSSTVVGWGTWAHLAMTWKSGGGQRAYLNGALLRERPASDLPIGDYPGAAFKIGTRAYDEPWGSVDGNIDDIRLYDAELSGRQIQELANLPAD